MRRRQQQPEPQDEVIDLTDRLAPYDDAALRPMEREAPPPPPEEPPLWEPLDLSFATPTRDDRTD